jgi:imidazolonepropionase-like amidohydrolase
MKKLFALAALALTLAATAVRAEPIIIDHVTLIDGTGRPAKRDMAVVVDGGKFTLVGPSVLLKSFPQDPKAPKPRRIDGTGKYLIPGLMDIHIHLDGFSRDKNKKWVVDRKAGLQALASYLYAGVTTVLDVGNIPENILPLRAAERAGKILAPHIFATGNLITYPGSHGTDIAVNVSAWPQAEAQLQAQLDSQHPDVIKITYDDEGWGSRPLIPILPRDLLQHILQFYNAHGVRTTVHISNEARALEAIYSGVDTLAHTPIQGPLSDGFVKMAAAKQIPFATTMMIGDNYSRLHEHPEYLDQPLYVATMDPKERARLKKLVADGGETALKNSRPLFQKSWRLWMKTQTPILQDNLRRIDEAGGVIATGTDGSNGAGEQRELELLAEAGIAPLEILKIATFNAARFLGKQETMGSIEEGKLADAVLLSADPTRDINACKAIVLVMKAGAIIDERKLPLAGGPQKRRMVN